MTGFTPFTSTKRSANAASRLRKYSRALAHDSIKTTERYCAKWVKARQDCLDGLVAGTWNAQRKELQGHEEKEG